MKYYIQETIFDESRNKNAGSKARQDINAIAEMNGFSPVEVEYDHKIREKKGLLSALIKLTNDWQTALDRFGVNDIVLIQFPINHHPFGMANKIKKMRQRGTKVIILIHDIDSLRMSATNLERKIKRLKVVGEDKSILSQADVIIAHNHKMMDSLIEMGINKNKLISLEIFDYLTDCSTVEKKRNQNDPVIIAGTLRKVKAEYVYHLPIDVKFNLYGVGYEEYGQKNISYKGSFMPEELLNIMEGSFGVVWDGYSDESCLGPLGEYLKVNNPHKTSLYLAAGIPVIVWENAAISKFITENQAGITIKSLKDIRKEIDKVPNDKYFQMVNNACEISKKLRMGNYASLALEKALSKIN